MPTGLARFNLILLGTLLLALGPVGCRSNDASDDGEVEATTLRLHIQTNPDPLDRHIIAPIGRSGNLRLVVEQNAFLSEIFVTEASLLDTLGGFQIRIQFDRQGTLILRQYTTAHRSRHLAIHSQFGEARWIAAPVIRKPITNGVLIFTPDASREEAERIVRGLMNVASEVKKEFGS